MSRWTNRSRGALLLAGVMATAGCLGNIGGSTNTDGSDNPDGLVKTDPTVVPLRALTPFELATTLRDLQQVDVSAIEALQPASVKGNVETLGSQDMVWGGDRADSLERALYDTATKYVNDGSQKACAEQSGTDFSCLKTELQRVLPLLFRRDISDADIEPYVAVASSNASALGRKDAVARAWVSAWMSSDFLYLTNIGEDGSQQLTQNELAGRLAYTLWQSAPDAELLAAAKSGKLASDADIEAQARRMLNDAKGVRGLSRFVQGWAGILNIGSRAKDSPDWNSSIIAQGMGETQQYLETWARSSDRSVRSLLYSPTAYVTPDLANFYGIQYPSGASGYAAVQLPPESRRYGLLTQLTFLGASTATVASSPAVRGHWAIEKLFCQAMGLPDPNTVAAGPKKQPTDSTRDYFERLGTESGCSACHKRLDAPGFPFEIYDGAGKLRLIEQNREVKSNTNLAIGSDIDANYPTEKEFFAAVAGSANVRSCLSTFMTSYALGRPATTDDKPLIDDASKKGEADTREALIAIVRSPSFRKTPSRAASK